LKNRIRSLGISPLSALLYLLLFFVFTSGVFAAEELQTPSGGSTQTQPQTQPQTPTQTSPQAFYGEPIRAVKVRGNKRTRDATVQRIVQLKTDPILNKETLNQARINLEKSGLFAEVHLSVQPYEPYETESADTIPRGVALLVEVEDKWTLVPVPFFSTDGSTFMGGLIVIESNLLGTGKQLISGAMGGTDGLSGFGVFVDPALFQTRYKLSLSGGGGVGDQEIATPDGKTALSFKSNSISGSLGLGYQFTREFSAGLRVRLEQQEISDIKGPAAENFTQSESQQQLGLQARYDATVPYGSLLKGFEVSGRGSYSFVKKNPAVHGKAALNIPTLSFQRLRLLAAAGWGDLPLIAEQPVSGSDGFRTLPFGKVTADDYWSAAVAYDLPVLSQDWGAMVISSFYEHGWYRSSAVGDFDFYGPGAGFRIYLRKIAIPALGVDVARNLQSGETVFSVAVGMQM